MGTEFLSSDASGTWWTWRPDQQSNWSLKWNSGRPQVLVGLTRVQLQFLCKSPKYVSSSRRFSSICCKIIVIYSFCQNDILIAVCQDIIIINIQICLCAVRTRPLPSMCHPCAGQNLFNHMGQACLLRRKERRMPARWLVYSAFSALLLTMKELWAQRACLSCRPAKHWISRD